MEIPLTQHSAGVKNGKVTSNSTTEGSVEGRDITAKSETTATANETQLTLAVQMQRLTNCEDEDELETVEIITLNSSGQQLGNETMAESYLVQGKTLLKCRQNEIIKKTVHLTYFSQGWPIVLRITQRGQLNFPG